MHSKKKNYDLESLQQNKIWHNYKIIEGKWKIYVNTKNYQLITIDLQRFKNRIYLIIILLKRTTNLNVSRPSYQVQFTQLYYKKNYNVMDYQLHLEIGSL